MIIFKSNIFESDTIRVTLKSVTFEIFGKWSESVGFDANNDLQEDLKISKVTLLVTNPQKNYLRNLRHLKNMVGGI